MPARRKILWLSHFLPYPPKGGAQIRSYNLIKELSSYHDVHLFCIADKSKLKAYFSDVDEGAKEAEERLGKYSKRLAIQWLPKRSSMSKYFILLRSLFLLDSYSVTLLRDLDVSQLIAFAQEIDFDFVHLDTVALTPYIKYLSARAINLNHHNIESDMMFRRAEKEGNPIKSFIFKLDAIKIRRIEKMSAKHLCNHIVCSELDKKRLKNILPSANISTIENGIDIRKDILDATETKERKGALFIGGLDWYPNADAVSFILSEVWPLVIKENQSATLDIVGKNPAAELKDLARKYEGVNLHGFVDDISYFYGTRKFFICPIRDGGGTKLKILDAMANFIPVLAHPIAFEGIDASPEIHYFAASNAEEFAEQIKRINNLSEDSLKKMMKRAFLLIKEKYDYKEIGERLANLYS